MRARSMRFLVVEENKDFRKYLMELISNHGDVYFDHNEEISLNRDYKNCLPDIVVIDLQLKNMNGFSAAKELMEEFPAAEVVLLTNFEDRFFSETAESLGIKRVIPKGLLYEFYDWINFKKDDSPVG